MIDRIGPAIIEQLKLELVRNKKVVSRKTIASFRSQVRRGRGFADIDVLGEFSAVVIDQGVKGHGRWNVGGRRPRQKGGGSPLQFKRDMINIGAIESWAAARALNVSKFALARAIASQGIEPVPYIDRAVRRVPVERFAADEAEKQVTVEIDKIIGKQLQPIRL